MRSLTIFILLLVGCSGDIPELGMVKGVFRPCPRTPTAVSTMADPGSDFHYIAPLMYKSTREDAFKLVENILGEYKEEEVNIQFSNDEYIHAEFKSKLLKLASDVEFYFPTNRNYIHIRSASRVGISDFGKNRSRVEGIRSILLK